MKQFENLTKYLSIDYNWGELHIYSPTRYDDDIELSDTVSFIWEIK